VGSVVEDLRCRRPHCPRMYWAVVSLSPAERGARDAQLGRQAGSKSIRGLASPDAAAVNIGPAYNRVSRAMSGSPVYGPPRPLWLYSNGMHPPPATIPPVALYHNAVYYPNWRIYRKQPPSTLNLDAISHIFYAFARSVPPFSHPILPIKPSPFTAHSRLEKFPQLPADHVFAV